MSYYGFTEEHQILTNKGFMFLHEFENYKDGKSLLVAGYNINLDQFVYDEFSLIVNPFAESQKMINMTQKNESRSVFLCFFLKTKKTLEDGEINAILMEDYIRKMNREKILRIKYH